MEAPLFSYADIDVARTLERELKDIHSLIPLELIIWRLEYWGSFTTPKSEYWRIFHRILDLHADIRLEHKNLLRNANCYTNVTLDKWHLLT
jgi:hypothetical protein